MKIIAHRGANHQAPENTLAAFKRALELGVDAIELDVFVLRTGELVVIHDIMVNRTTNGEGYVIDFTFQDIRQLDAGNGEKVPTLSEAIELVNRQVPIIIELKAVGTGKAVAKLINQYLAKGWQREDFEIVSFNHHEMVAFRRDCPGIRTGASLAGIPVDYCAFAKNMGVESVMLCGEFLTPEFIKDAHDHDITVYGYAWEPFTADIKSEIERLQALGLDGWASDRPDIARGFLT
jgi:glycerophosphoryl diester phosphodiesterase